MHELLKRMSLILKKNSMKDLIAGKCPKCKTGKIFSDNGSIFLLKEPKMHTHCTTCGYRFEKEPGYFIGSLYVSYALAVAEMLALFIALVFWVDIYWILGILLLTLVLVSFINFRFARIIWIWIFQY